MSIIKDLCTGKEKPSKNAVPLTERGKIEEAISIQLAAAEILSALMDILDEYDRVHVQLKREQDEVKIKDWYKKLNELSIIRRKAKENYMRYFQHALKTLG